MSDQYYRFFPGDYARATPDLSLVEHGAYRLMLDAYYSTGPLTTDPVKLSRICRATTPEEQRAVETVAGRFFMVDGDVLRNRKADHEIAGRQHFLEEQARKAKMGAAARWKDHTDAPGDARGEDSGKPRAMPGGCPDDALPSPSPCPDPGLSPDPYLSQNTGIGRFANDAHDFSSSDGGNGHGKPARKGRPYIDDIEIVSVQRRVLDVWEEHFGKSSGKERLKAAKAITAMTRPLDGEWIEDDFLAAVDWYAAQRPTHPMSPAEFFGQEFPETAKMAGVK